MKTLEDIQIIRPESITVAELIKSPIKLVKLNGDIGMNNKIIDKNLYRPQLALAGYVGLFSYKRVQIFGHTEYFYLYGLGKEKREEAFKTICEFSVPCIVLTNNQKLDEDLLKIASDNEIPVLTTPADTTKTIFLLTEVLDDHFAEQSVVHGSFVDVFGVGCLFVGKSGIGKSEIALDLVERGHRLVADDIVMFTKKKETTLMGTGTNLVKHFMEIRGLGIIDIKQMFGVRSIRFQKRLEIVIELMNYDSSQEFTRTGLEDEPISIMGCDISTVKLPIYPGKNVTVIAEVIAMNYLLKTYGYDAAQVFADNLSKEIIKNKGKKGFIDKRHITYFQADDE